MTQDETGLPGLDVERLAAALADPELKAAARGLRMRLRLACDAAGLDLLLEGGEAWRAEAAGAADVTLTAPEAVWRAALAAVPPPRHQSFTALQLANPAAAVEGDPLRIAQARGVLERLLECLRPATPPRPLPRRDLSGIAGRYLRLRAADGEHDIFTEEAGQGIPVVLLHTAGADARQYQALLADPGLTARYRLIAFDCPFHGRSLPPLDWDGGAYGLSQGRYLDWVASFLRQAVGQPAILVGCSMGAAITLVAAAEVPELLRGAIALEPPLRSPGRRNPYLAHAAVAAGVHNAAYVRGLMSPTSPEAERRRAAWIYAQGGPGIYGGDLAFYSDEFDGAVIGPRIDTARCPLRLLTGDYDYSASPEDGEALAALIPGSVFQRMPGLGHFPMTEDPERFLRHFTPALDAVAAAGAAG
jgi:pimeloyl-ACP methyl ester carboxylesterase